MSIDRLPPSKRAWSYVCRICGMPILTNCHGRHTDATGTYHLVCELGGTPLHAELLPRLARER